MPTTSNGIYYPDLSDNFDAIQGDFATLASSVDAAMFTGKVQIFNVTNIADRNNQANDFGPTTAKPMVVWRQDAQTLEATVNGINWYQYGQLGRNGVPFRMAAGTINVTIGSGTATGSASVTFPAGRFTVAPLIQVSPIAAGRYTASQGGVSTTGMTVYGHAIAGNVSNNISFAVHWTAIQMLSGAASG